MPELPSEIDRINALTTNARNTWLVLLATLVFVGVILAFAGTDSTIRHSSVVLGIDFRLVLLTNCLDVELRIALLNEVIEDVE